MTSSPPQFTTIPQSQPDLRSDDFDYLGEILRTRQVAAGPLVEALEKAFCRRIGTHHAVAVSHGTSALHLALLALKIRPGDEVIVPSYACAALLHAIHYTGASPVLCDIHPDTLNPTYEDIHRCLTRQTRAIILTHTFGFPAEISAILSLEVPVIEDCAQALGAQFCDQAVGSFGVMSVFSFYATKVICSGEGGMVCTNKPRLAARLRDLVRPDQRSDYQVRYNYKLSDLSAGLALRQLARLDDLVRRRCSIAARYRDAFSVCPHLRFQCSIPTAQPIYYRFVVLTHHARALMRSTVAEGVVCDRPVFRPLHAYLKLPARVFPGTTQVWRTAVSIPLYPALTDDEVSRVVSTVQTAVM